MHVDGKVDPINDKEVIDFELQLKDLETVQKQLEGIKRKVKTGDKGAVKEQEVLLRYEAALEAGKSARTVELTEDELLLISGLHLLTIKPVMYVCNVDESSVVDGDEHVEAVRLAVKDEKAEVIMIGAQIEADIAELESFEERAEFLQDMGLQEAGVNVLIRAAYELLQLDTYFTAGVKEVRAWTINKGMTAPQAAGVIHTDFEKGFIRAEVIKYNDFVALGSESACKDAGKMGVEGKEYIVEDGDIMHFRFNV